MTLAAAIMRKGVDDGNLKRIRKNVNSLLQRGKMQSYSYSISETIKREKNALRLDQER